MPTRMQSMLPNLPPPTSRRALSRRRWAASCSLRPGAWRCRLPCGGWRVCLRLLRCSPPTHLRRMLPMPSSVAGPSAAPRSAQRM